MEQPCLNVSFNLKPCTTHTVSESELSDLQAFTPTHVSNFKSWIWCGGTFLMTCLFIAPLHALISKANGVNSHTHTASRSCGSPHTLLRFQFIKKDSLNFHNSFYLSSARDCVCGFNQVLIYQITGTLLNNLEWNDRKQICVLTWRGGGIIVMECSSHLTLFPDDLMSWTMSLWRNPSTAVSLTLAMVSPVNQ